MSELKRIVITGANGGVGKILVKDLLSSGYFVYAIDLNFSNFEKEDNLILIECDLRDSKKRNDAINFIRENTDNLYAIINLAGIFMMESLLEGDDEDLRKIIDINFFSMYYLNKGLFDIMDKGSKIINMSSEVARYSPQPFMLYYTMTKMMVNYYSDALRRECNYLGINVVKVEAGSMKTPMLSAANKDFDKLYNQSTHFKNQLLKMKFLMDKELERTNSVSNFSYLVLKILKKKNPKILYKYKNSLKLKLLGIIPEKMQDNIFKKLVK